MTTPTTTAAPARTSGRGWAYLGALLGGAVSIAANIAHSYIPPTHTTDSDWHPETGAVIGSVFWPIALFVAVEILTRVPWPTGRGWTLLRFGGLLPVALVAAVVSYRHLSGLLDHYREDALTVTIGPLAVDGLMIMATGALLATATHTTIPVGDPAVDTTPADTPAPTEPAPAEAEPVITDPATVTRPAPETTDTDTPVFAPWAPPAARLNGTRPNEVTA